MERSESTKHFCCCFLFDLWSYRWCGKEQQLNLTTARCLWSGRRLSKRWTVGYKKKQGRHRHRSNICRHCCLEWCICLFSKRTWTPKSVREVWTWTCCEIVSCFFEQAAATPARLNATGPRGTFHLKYKLVSLVLPCVYGRLRFGWRVEISKALVIYTGCSHQLMVGLYDLLVFFTYFLHFLFSLNKLLTRPHPRIETDCGCACKYT